MYIVCDVDLIKTDNTYLKHSSMMNFRKYKENIYFMQCGYLWKKGFMSE